MNCDFTAEGFMAVQIHTAKCAVCNDRNKSELLRCKNCGWQICKPCVEKKETTFPDRPAMEHGPKPFGEAPRQPDNSTTPHTLRETSAATSSENHIPSASALTLDTTLASPPQGSMQLQMRKLTPKSSGKRRAKVKNVVEEGIENSMERSPSPSDRKRAKVAEAKGLTTEDEGEETDRYVPRPTSTGRYVPISRAWQDVNPPPLSSDNLTDVGMGEANKKIAKVKFTGVMTQGPRSTDTGMIDSLSVNKRRDEVKNKDEEGTKDRAKAKALKVPAVTLPPISRITEPGISPDIFLENQHHYYTAGNALLQPSTVPRYETAVPERIARLAGQMAMRRTAEETQTNIMKQYLENTNTTAKPKGAFTRPAKQTSTMASSNPKSETHTKQTSQVQRDTPLSAFQHSDSPTVNTIYAIVRSNIAAQTVGRNYEIRAHYDRALEMELVRAAFQIISLFGPNNVPPSVRTVLAAEDSHAAINLSMSQRLHLERELTLIGQDWLRSIQPGPSRYPAQYTAYHLPHGYYPPPYPPRYGPGQYYHAQNELFRGPANYPPPGYADMQRDCQERGRQEQRQQLQTHLPAHYSLHNTSAYEYSPNAYQQSADFAQHPSRQALTGRIDSSAPDPTSQAARTSQVHAATPCDEHDESGQVGQCQEGERVSATRCENH